MTDHQVVMVQVLHVLLIFVHIVVILLTSRHFCFQFVCYSLPRNTLYTKYHGYAVLLMLFSLTDSLS